MPKVTLGRRRLPTNGSPYERTPDKETDNKRGKFISEIIKNDKSPKQQGGHAHFTAAQLKARVRRETGNSSQQSVAEKTTTIPRVATSTIVSATKPQVRTTRTEPQFPIIIGPKPQILTSLDPKSSNIRKLTERCQLSTQFRADFNGSSSSNGKPCLPWVDRNFPTDLEELFVHKKKVEEVKEWMEHALDPAQNFIPMKMCLLSGPTGVGKTATAYLVAKSLNAEVMEWINPMSLTEFNRDNFIPGDPVGQSQLDLFTNFLFRASRYQSLPIKGKPEFDDRVIIVEDFPNTFYRDSQTFQNILKNYYANGIRPLIFIATDSASGELSSTKLFPKKLLMELNISQISFNPVAVTYMKKFVKTVCQRENVEIESTIIDNLVEASGGDVRSAINTLQFKILQERPAPTKQRIRKKVTRDKMFQGSDLTQKDHSLFLFRALGKVLYNKRDRTKESPIELELKEELSDQRRPHVTQDVPEDIANNIECSTETFLGFLHQNFPHFFGTVESCAKAASYLADSEVLLSRWNYDDNNCSKNYKNQDTREQLALSLGLRGLMHSNDARVTNEWRALRKPLCGDIRFQVQKVKEEAKSLLSTDPESIIESFYYETIPFYAKGLGQMKPANRNFFKRIGLMKDSKQLKPRPLDTLDELGVVLEDKDTDLPGPSHDHSDSYEMRVSNQNTVKDTPPEDYFIDEYD